MKKKWIEEYIESLYFGLLKRPPDKFGFEHYFENLKTQKKSPAEILRVFLNSNEYKDHYIEDLFVPPGHFYSPIVNTVVAKLHLQKLTKLPDNQVIEGIEIDLHKMKKLWSKLIPYFQDFPLNKDKSDIYLYSQNNPSYCFGDALILNAMIRHNKPKQIIEIGSGWSSACIIDAISQESANIKLSFIDPYTQLLEDIAGYILADHRVIKSSVQNVPLSIFKELKSGDILFIDSTHILSTGSDVHYELFEILPIIPSGVIIHIHDIFWPFEYPESWILEENRSWNEIYALRAYLTNNPQWEILFFNDYFSKNASTLILDTYPIYNNSAGAALWLQKK
jgi:hypothetical protein